MKRMTLYGVLLCATLSGGARLGFAQTNYAFNYHQGGIPDFDQKRQNVGTHSGLPGDGVNHCAPTSGVNCVAFIANHGYGTVPPFGPTDWTDPNTYNYASQTIYSMGTAMNTSQFTGTTGADHVDGMRHWLTKDLGWIQFSDFVVTAKFASGASCPGATELAGPAAQGGLVMPVVGWYSDDNGDGTKFTRRGGHVLTMNRFVWTNTPNGLQIRISWRDPASDDGNFVAQSNFTTETYTLNPIASTFDGSMRTQYNVVGFNSGANFGFIDGYVAVVPKFGFAWAPGDFEFDLVDFSHITGSYHTPTFVPADGGIHRAALADATRAAYLTIPNANQQSGLRRLDLMNAVSNTIQDGIINPIAIAVSRQRRTYVLEIGGNELGGYDLDGTEGNLRAILSQPFSAVACDDFADLIYVFSSGNRRLVVLPPDLSSQTEIVLPPNLPAGSGAQMFVSPVTGNVWILDPGTTALYELAVGSNHVAAQVNTVFDAALGSATALSLDSFDHVYVGSSGGGGLEFAPDGAGGYFRVSPSILDGLSLGSMFQMSSDRSNFDPNTMVGPAFENVLPTEYAIGVPDGAPSAFDADAGEWSIAGFDFGFPPAPYAESDAEWNPTGGNPGGALETGDLYNETFFAAPLSYLGDRSNMYGANLTFDVLIRANDLDVHPAVILASSSKRLFFVAAPTDIGVWTTRTIPLGEIGWRVDDVAGPDATAEDMLDVLGDLQGLYINATWSAGDDDTLLDNVYFGGQVPPPCPGDVTGDGVVDLSDLATLLAHYGEVGVDRSGGDLDGDGDVDLSDLADMLGHYGEVCR